MPYTLSVCWLEILPYGPGMLPRVVCSQGCSSWIPVLLIWAVVARLILSSRALQGFYFTLEKAESPPSWPILAPHSGRGLRFHSGGPGATSVGLLCHGQVRETGNVPRVSPGAGRPLSVGELLYRCSRVLEQGLSPRCRLIYTTLRSCNRLLCVAHVLGLTFLHGALQSNVGFKELRLVCAPREEAKI